jgi:hypothetical protein
MIVNEQFDKFFSGSDHVLRTGQSRGTAAQAAYPTSSVSELGGEAAHMTMHSSSPSFRQE